MSRHHDRVLLADPQRATRDSIRRALEIAGYDVETASSGAEIILQCQIDPPDILIMELQLPDMDGFEVCGYVRRETHDTDLTVILMTGVDDEMTRTYLGPMVEFAGGDYFFAKPCDKNAVVMLLEEVTMDREACTETAPDLCPTHVVWPTRLEHPRARGRTTQSPTMETVRHSPLVFRESGREMSRVRTGGGWSTPPVTRSPAYTQPERFTARGHECQRHDP